MKILSQFQDYYDYSCGYHDDSTFYARDLLLELDESVVKKLDDIIPQYRYWKDDIDRYTCGVIIVNNIMYPFMKHYRMKDDSLVLLDMVYGEDLLKYSLGKRIFPYNGERFQIDHPIAIFDKSNVVIPKGLKPKNFKGQHYEYNYQINKKMVYNACLKQYKFPIDGRIVLQEVETFLNRNKEMMSSTITDDIVLRNAKGFDNYSFKKMKSEN